MPDWGSAAMTWTCRFVVSNSHDEAGCEPTAANGCDDGFDIRTPFQDFDAQGRVALDDPLVVEGAGDIGVRMLGSEFG